MFRGILAPLAAVAVVTGLTSNVYARPISQSQPGTGLATLSDQPLAGIESRNVAKDYPTRFSETLPTSPNNHHKVVAQVRAHSSSKKLPFGLGNLGNKVKIDAGGDSGDTYSYGRISDPFLLHEANGDVNSHVSVQYQLQEQ
jgi:hypothetical protein